MCLQCYNVWVSGCVWSVQIHAVFMCVWNVSLNSCMCVKFVHAISVCAFVCVHLCVSVCVYKCGCTCTKSVCTCKINRKYHGVHVCGRKRCLKVYNFTHTFCTHTHACTHSHTHKHFFGNNIYTCDKNLSHMIKNLYITFNKEDLSYILFSL